MSQENVEVVRAAFAAYMGDDEVTIRRLVAPDVLISTRPDQPDARDHRGHEGMLDASAEWLEAWDQYSFETARVWDAGDDLVFTAAQESGRGKRSGVPMETQAVFVSTLRGGRIVRIQIFGSEREALKAVGLAE